MPRSELIGPLGTVTFRKPIMQMVKQEELPTVLVTAPPTGLTT